MRRAAAALACAGLQVLVLAWMAGERELILLTGRTVRFRTAPVDPRDLFRGDYVRLDYEISTVHESLCRDGLPDLLAAKPDERSRSPWWNATVYAVLRIEEDGLAELDHLTDRRPAEAPSIRGRIEAMWGSTLQVRYGIEAYFVEQGKGLELERPRRREGIQVPLEMEAALSGSGVAILKGHRWSPIGIGLEITGSKQEPNMRIPTAVTLRLLNASSADLAVVDLPGGRSFTLDPDRREWRPPSWKWINAGSPRPAPQEAHVRVLRPGEVQEVRIDLEDPIWHVQPEDGPPRSLGRAEWSARFRFVYRPPSREECSALSRRDIIWHGVLPSRALQGGRVD